MDQSHPTEGFITIKDFSMHPDELMLLAAPTRTARIM